MKHLLFCLLVVVGLPVFSQTVKHVNAEEFKKYVDSKKYVLIDLRTDDEIKSKGKIKGAVHIDFLAKNSEDIISKLDKKRSYLLYCAGGGRSGQCAELMEQQGFKEIVDLEKGFGDWKNKGYEIEVVK
jgi:rhodanese-related sulfurtransferase